VATECGSGVETDKRINDCDCQRAAREVEERENRTRGGVGEPVSGSFLESPCFHSALQPETTPSWEPVSAALARGLKWTRVGRLGRSSGRRWVRASEVG
jgi:hypothetical protein